MAEQNLGKVAITTAGAYDSSVEYGQLTIVTYGGESWLSRTTVPVGNPPSEDSDYWQLILSPKIERKEMTSPSASINPNTFYVWGEMASLDITLNEGASAEENRYMFQFRNPKSGATVLTLPDDILWSVDTELGDDGLPLFGKGEYTRIEIIEGLASVKKWALPYIIFADAEVERVLMANGLGDGTGITKQEAKGVTSIGTWFKENTTIETFDELRFFSAIRDFGYYAGGNTADAAFYNCTSLKSIQLPPNLRSISRFTFYNCTNLEFDFANLPKSITHIVDSFDNCVKCHGVVALPNLTFLEYFAFRGTNIVGVADLGKITQTPQCYETSGAFTSDTLRYAILPDTLTQMGLGTFSNTPSLEAVILKCATPPSFLGGSPFAVISAPNLSIYVPDASVETYKAATGWNDTSLVSRIKGISDLQTDNPTLYEEIAEYL